MSRLMNRSVIQNHLTENTKAGTIVRSIDNPGQGWLECDGNAFLRTEYQALSTIFTEDAWVSEAVILPSERSFSTVFNTGSCLLGLPWGETSKGDLSIYYTKSLYRSVDEGLTWTRIINAFGGDNIGYASKIVKAQDTGVIALLNRNGNKAYFSIDDGLSWTASTNIPTMASWGMILYWNPVSQFVVMQYNNPAKLYITADFVTWTEKLLVDTADKIYPDYGWGAQSINEYGSEVFYYQSNNGLNWNLTYYLPDYDYGYAGHSTTIKPFWVGLSFKVKFNNKLIYVTADYDTSRIETTVYGEADHDIINFQDINLNHNFGYYAAVAVNNKVLCLSKQVNNKRYVSVSDDGLQWNTVQITGELPDGFVYSVVGTNNCIIHPVNLYSNNPNRIMRIKQDPTKFNIPYLYSENNFKYYIFTGQ